MAIQSEKSSHPHTCPWCGGPDPCGDSPCDECRGCWWPSWSQKPVQVKTLDGGVGGWNLDGAISRAGQRPYAVVPRPKALTGDVLFFGVGIYRFQVQGTPVIWAATGYVAADEAAFAKKLRQPESLEWIELTSGEAARFLLDFGGGLLDPTAMACVRDGSDLILAAPESPAGSTDEPPRGKKTASPKSRSGATSPKMTPGARAIAAAYELRLDKQPVSLNAACKKARVDRENLRENYPEAVEVIRALGLADQAPRRGVVDRRTGQIEAVDED